MEQENKKIIISSSRSGSNWLFDAKIAEAENVLDGEIYDRIVLPSHFELDEDEESDPTEWPTTNKTLLEAIGIMADGAQKAVDALAEMTKQLVLSMTPVVQELLKQFDQEILKQKEFEEMAAAYPKGRVVHLATHAKKARTRKKNINRIKKYFKR